jgi:hypothetical protein
MIFEYIMLFAFLLTLLVNVLVIGIVLPKKIEKCVPFKSNKHKESEARINRRRSIQRMNRKIYPNPRTRKITAVNA